MTLPLYSTQLFFPGGGEAANWPVQVWLRASNQLALLFQDASGTTPAANPSTTDSMGFLSFHAAPGDYVALLAGDMFPVFVDDSETDPVYPGLFVFTQAVPAAVWSIAHHFGIPPSVDVLLSGGESEAEVSHPDGEHTVITFGAPTTGTAHLRR